MAAILSTNDLVAGMRTPQGVFKTVTVTAGLFASIWATAGLPGAGAAPATGAGALQNSLTPGALPVPVLTTGQDLYLNTIELACTQACVFQVIDRLVASSGLNGTLATAQTIGTPAQDARYSDQVGVALALEWYTATGATSVTATVSYTNQSGVAGRSATATVPANAPAGRFLPVALAAGDTGVQTVQSVTLSLSTGTAGNFGVTLYRVLATLGLPAPNLSAGKDFAALGLPDVGSAATSAACLSLIMLPTTSGTSVITGSYGMVTK